MQANVPSSEMSLLAGVPLYQIRKLVRANLVPYERVAVGRGITLFSRNDVEAVREAARKAGYIKPTTTGVTGGR